MAGHVPDSIASLDQLILFRLDSNLFSSITPSSFAPLSSAEIRFDGNVLQCATVQTTGNPNFRDCRCRDGQHTLLSMDDGVCCSDGITSTSCPMSWAWSLWNHNTERPYGDAKTETSTGKNNGQLKGRFNIGSDPLTVASSFVLPGRLPGTNTFRFDGAANHVGIEGGTTVGGGALSICAWVRFDTFGHYMRVVDFNNGLQRDNVKVHNTENSDMFTFVIQNGGRKMDFDVANFFELNEFVHFCVSVDTSRVVRAFKNGVSIGCTGGTACDDRGRGTNGVLPTRILRQQSYIGKAMKNDDDYFKGIISDVTILDGDAVTTDAEATQIMRSSGVVPSTSAGISTTTSTGTSKHINAFDTYTEFADIACIGRNELGAFVASQLACESACTRDPDCVSFEHYASIQGPFHPNLGQMYCQLSNSCTLDLTQAYTGHTVVFYLKVAATNITSTVSSNSTSTTSTSTSTSTSTTTSTSTASTTSTSTSSTSTSTSTATASTTSTSTSSTSTSTASTTPSTMTIATVDATKPNADAEACIDIADWVSTKFAGQGCAAYADYIKTTPDRKESACNNDQEPGLLASCCACGGGDRAGSDATMVSSTAATPKIVGNPSESSDGKTNVDPNESPSQPAEGSTGNDPSSSSPDDVVDAKNPAGAIVGGVAASLAFVVILLAYCQGWCCFKDCRAPNEVPTNVYVAAPAITIVANPTFPSIPYGAVSTDRINPTYDAVDDMLALPPPAYETVVEDDESDAPGAAPAGGFKQCAQKTSRGQCRNQAVSGFTRCVDHKCTISGCTKSKSSKAASCPVHMKEAAEAKALYEPPSTKQAQLYDDGEVPGAADHFAVAEDAAYASLTTDQQTYGDARGGSALDDGLYEDVGSDSDDDDVEI